MSQRLELVIQHAFDKTIDYEQYTKIFSQYLDKTINKVYTFYSGYKRIIHLKQTCDKHNQKLFFNKQNYSNTLDSIRL